MEIEMASQMGFCFGVRRAIDLVERAAQRGSVESLGAIVHNQQVVQRLADYGVTVVAGLDELKGNTIAITSHGVGPELIEEIKGRGLQLIDTTCPFVRKAQAVAQKLAQAGFSVLIFGDINHPEVQGLLGWAQGKGIATADEDFALSLDLPRRLGVLCQTTQSPLKFANFIRRLQAKAGQDRELQKFNTICPTTRRRHRAALELAKRVDLMLVIGGHNSANTRHLAESCASAGVETHLLEEAAELNPTWLQNRRRIGLTAGASTPENAIDQVVSRLEEMASGYSV